jgi:hypothetical protein
MADFERDLAHAAASRTPPCALPGQHHRQSRRAGADGCSAACALLPDRGDRLLLGVDLVKDVKRPGNGLRRRGRRHPRLQSQYLRA